MKYLDYREKLGIGINDEDKTEMLKSHVKFFFDYIYDRIDNSFDFCFYPEKQFFFIAKDYFLKISEYPKKNFNIFPQVIDSILNNPMLEIIVRMTIFLNIITRKEYFNEKYFNEIKEKYLSIFSDLNIQYDLIEDEDGIFIFPKGAKELDDALVSEPLEWLSAYPESHRAFVKALKSYANVTSETASDVADLFRKALETFFQEFFKSGSSLEKLLSEYGTYLKDKGIPSELSGDLKRITDSYAHFMNDYAKHHDKTSINVLEYIMYQTGNIIRLVITLNQKEQQNAN